MSTKRRQPDFTEMRSHATFKELLEALIEEARASGITVELKPKSVLKDYAAMNSEAAKVMGFPMPENTIYIGQDDSPADKYHELRHEYDEMGRMRAGQTYWQAHTAALKSEDTKALPPPINGATVEGDLKQSLSEEEQAVREYKEREQLAEETGDKGTAKLYKHIRPEEQQHAVEIRERIKKRKAPRISPPWRRLR